MTSGNADGRTGAIAFHGTADPWAETEEIIRLCEEREIPLYLTPKANHSLETGDIDTDIDTMKSTMKIVRNYAEQDH